MANAIIVRDDGGRPEQSAVEIISCWILVIL
jgi:hypothetical protein